MRKIHIYPGDAEDTSGPDFGFAALKTNSMVTLTLDIALKKVEPGKRYDIWVNQYPATHLMPEPAGIVTTDAKGKGNVSVSVARLAGTSGFWISVTSGNEVFRSAAIDF
jgi:hypothetical protein